MKTLKTMLSSVETLIRWNLVINVIIAIAIVVSLVVPSQNTNAQVVIVTVIVLSFVLGFRISHLTKEERKQNEQKIAQLEKDSKRRTPIRNSSGKTFYLPLADVPEENNTENL